MAKCKHCGRRMRKDKDHCICCGTYKNWDGKGKPKMFVYKEGSKKKEKERIKLEMQKKKLKKKKWKKGKCNHCGRMIPGGFDHCQYCRVYRDWDGQGKPPKKKVWFGKKMTKAETIERNQSWLFTQTPWQKGKIK